MNSSQAALVFISIVLVSCTSHPVVSVPISRLEKGHLTGKTIAVCGFTASDTATYPGQVSEMQIIEDAGLALRGRLKHSKVLVPEEAWARAGVPSTKFAPNIPMALGKSLTSAYIRKTHAQGIDYLLWIDMRSNYAKLSSSQSKPAKTMRPPCRCSRCRTGSSCRSTCTAGACRNGGFAPAFRRVSASYSLLDTSTGDPVWRAD